MTNQHQDPYRHWDGSQWLRWDGQIWKPEDETDSPTEAATVARPTAVDDSTFAPDRTAAPMGAAGSGRHRAPGPTSASRQARAGWLIGGLAVALIGVGGVAFKTLQSDVPPASASPMVAPIIATPKTLVAAIGTADKDLVEFTPTSAWTLMATYNCNNLGGHGAFTLTNVANNYAIFVRADNTHGHTSKTYPFTGRIHLKVTTNCVWSVRATQP
jgi:hypothetical protein